jgi:recombination protein RecT
VANVNGGLVAQNQQGNQPAPIATVKGLLCKVDYKKRFEDILGKKAPGFISSIINISSSPTLKECEPNSIVSSAVVAATLDLPIDQNLGFAYIVPYNDKKKGKVAQFQMGYKGFIQLAMRSGQYKTISSSEVYEGEIKKYNRITGEIEFNEEFFPDENSKVVGYIAYFKLLNGFEKYQYMTIKELQAHGKKYSQSYKSNNQWARDNSLWNTDFQSMATKTVLKLLLSKYGILSIEMQKALETDQAVIKNDVADGAEVNSSNVEYVDNPENNEHIQDVEYSETKEDIYEGSPFESEQ